jgi:hypothetical protein
MTSFCAVCLEEVEQNKLNCGICIYCWKKYRDKGKGYGIE